MCFQMGHTNSRMAADSCSLCRGCGVERERTNRHLLATPGDWCRRVQNRATTVTYQRSAGRCANDTDVKTVIKYTDMN